MQLMVIYWFAPRTGASFLIARPFHAMRRRCTTINHPEFRGSRVGPVRSTGQARSWCWMARSDCLCRQGRSVQHGFAVGSNVNLDLVPGRVLTFEAKDARLSLLVLIDGLDPSRGELWHLHPQGVEDGGRNFA